MEEDLRIALGLEQAPPLLELTPQAGAIGESPRDGRRESPLGPVAEDHPIPAVQRQPGEVWTPEPPEDLPDGQRAWEPLQRIHLEVPYPPTVAGGPHGAPIGTGDGYAGTAAVLERPQALQDSAGTRRTTSDTEQSAAVAKPVHRNLRSGRLTQALQYRMRPLLPVLLAACSPPVVEGPRITFEPDSTSAYAMPWPGDQFRDADGTVSFEAFRRPAGIPLVESYVELGESLHGWGTNSPVHFRVDDPASVDVPTPAASLETTSAYVLVDVDPDSPFRGERFPVDVHVSDIVSPYQPEGLVTVAPTQGFPLRGGTTYALVFTTSGFGTNLDFLEVFERDHPHHALWEDVLPVLRDHGLRKRDLAGGTVFTTQDPLDEMQRIADLVQNTLDPADLSPQATLVASYTRYDVYETRYESPVFTFGERPFLTEGGAFQFGPDGTPLIASWDSMRTSVCVPRDVPVPDGGWPVVVYQHGTGGDYLTMCDSDHPWAFANLVGERGFVTIGIDQPLHGTRNGGEPQNDIANFNLFNPTSGQTNFRQGAADALYLTRSLHDRPTTLQLPDGTSLPLDPDNITFFGHSQGGLTGAIATPFWTGDVKATVLSGAGGLLAITVVDRKDILDFAQLVGSIARFLPDEEVHELHPLLGVVQTLVEPTDPINYAPYWFREAHSHPGHTPSSVLATSGTDDEATPYRTALAMATAASLPALPPSATPMPGLELRGIADTPSPATENATAYDGPITAGFSQWEDGSHFVVFQEPRAIDLYRDYLRSAVQGSPTLDLAQSEPDWAGGF